MSWEDVLKMPPIRNPREEEFSDTSNDELTDDELKRLFEEVADPIIMEEAEAKGKWATVPLTDLKMSKQRAEEVARALYKDKGYPQIFSSDEEVYFRLQGQ